MTGILKKTAAVAAVAVLAAAAAVFPVTASAASATYTVTYKTPFFSDITKKVNEYSAPEEITITEVHGELYGESGHDFVADGLEVIWYADEDYTEAYGFDEALTEDLTLYGKITETSRNFKSNGYGYDVRSGKIYAGDAVDDNYFTTDAYTSPSYTDPDTGGASFLFDGIQYAVYGRGLDVTKPFTVTFDFTDIEADESGSTPTLWFLYSLFPALALAQGGACGPWANAGACSVMMFNVGDEGTPQTITSGMSLVNYTSTSVTEYESASAFKALFADGNTEVSFTCEITDEGTTFSSGDTVVATSPATRGDFPSGYAYMSFASNGSGDHSLSFDVEIEQETDGFTVSGDENAELGDLSVSGMAVTLPVTCAEGYSIESITANGEEIAYVSVYGSEGVYALDIEKWGPETEIYVTTAAEEEEKTSGCGSTLLFTAGGAGVAGALCLAAAACMKRKKAR